MGRGGDESQIDFNSSLVSVISHDAKSQCHQTTLLLGSIIGQNIFKIMKLHLIFLEIQKFGL